MKTDMYVLKTSFSLIVQFKSSMKDSNTDVLLMYKGLLLTGKSDKTRFIDEMGRKNKWQGLIIPNDKPLLFSIFNPNWHQLRKQEKCSPLAPPRSKFYKTQ